LQMNPFSAMGGTEVSGMGTMGNMGGSSMGGMDGWNNTMAGMFMKQFQQGSAARGGGGFDSGYMSGMGGGGGNSGMNAGMGGGYGKSDNGSDKRRF